MFLIGWFILSGCSSEDKKSDLVSNDDKNKKLEIKIEINDEIYLKSDYGEAPQIAVWLEDSNKNFLKTVWVTERAGKNKWKGKVNCPLALPYWTTRKKDENKSPFWKRVADAITGATVPRGNITASALIPDNSKIYCYVEVNASGDYNEEFGYWSKSGVPDSEGNGQPSIIYESQISPDSSNKYIPRFIGRTEQRTPAKIINRDTSGITTAKNLIKSITITCLRN